MLQTLFVIPHWLLDGPLLVVWIVIGLVYLGWQLLRGGGADQVMGFIPVWGIVAAVIFFVLPRVEVSGIDPANPEGPHIAQGLAIRGYGVMLLTAIVSGVGLAMSRCEKIGVTKDQILQLAFWMMICGIAGARLFYVIQKSDQFFTDGFSLAALAKIVNMTQGGLVVYGSLIGGTIGGLIFMQINRLPMWKTADIIAPGMVLGLAIGRIGCLMNGCCYGGVCSDDAYPGVTFPAGSPPYMRQLAEGELLGISGSFDNSPEDEYPLTVSSVTDGSFAQRHGIEIGDQIRIGTSDGDYLRFKTANPGADSRVTVAIINNRRDAQQIAVPLDALPLRSARTHPTQIYSSITALTLCLILWFFWKYKRYDGQVFALMIILYAIARFLMEIVRRDERGQFGTDFTISQWVSMIMLLVGFGLFLLVIQRSNPNHDVATT